MCPGVPTHVLSPTVVRKGMEFIDKTTQASKPTQFPPPNAGSQVWYTIIYVVYGD